MMVVALVLAPVLRNAPLACAEASPALVQAALPLRLAVDSTLLRTVAVCPVHLPG